MDLSKVRTGLELQLACETNTAQGFLHHWNGLSWSVFLTYCGQWKLQKNSCTQRCKNVVLGSCSFLEQEQEQVNHEVDLVKYTTSENNPGIKAWFLFILECWLVFGSLSWLLSSTFASNSQMHLGSQDRPGMSWNRQCWWSHPVLIARKWVELSHARKQHQL